MKIKNLTNSRVAVASGVAIAALAVASASAQDAKPGFYMSTDAGLNMMTGIRTSGGGELRIDPGMRWGLEAGYGIKLADHLTLGFEAESGIIWNGLSSDKGDGSETELGGNLYQIPILANVVVNYHVGKWTPYVGLGGGLDYISANIWSIDNSPAIYAHDDFGPAVQATAGVRYQLSERCELGLGYKYLTAFSEELGGGPRLSEVNNHTISLNFTFHF